MIGALALAFQLGAVATPVPPASPATLVVRGVARQATVPVVTTSAGPALRADLVAASLGGSLRTLPNGHFQLTLPGVAFDLTEQVPFARAGDDVLPLVAAPYRAAGKLYVPLQLVAELLPAKGSGVIYDARLGELRVFSAGTPRRVARTERAPARAAGESARRPNPRVAGADAETPVSRATRLRTRRRVVVDAGHGGPDRGMHGPIDGGPQIHEKEITLAVARRVAAELRERGIDVVMTRTTDTLIALADRGRIANASHADLFVSVHVNAANPTWKAPGAARGFETYFLAEAKTEDAQRVERMENEAVRFETGAYAAKGDPLSFIINDMAQNEHLRESNDLATTIQRELGRVHPGPDRGVRQANFAVLRTSFMPAVLVELGFGTNRQEAAFLGDAREQSRMASAIADATLAYLTRYERRVGAGDGR